MKHASASNPINVAVACEDALQGSCQNGRAAFKSACASAILELTRRKPPWEGAMESDFERTSNTAHLIFFETIESAGTNRRALARLALSMANRDDGRTIALSGMLNTLRWSEYQTMLSLLSLKAHTAIRWDEYELGLLRRWADEPSAGV